VEQAGRAVLVSGDVGSPAHCRTIAQKVVSELGGIDILVNNAAHQATFNSVEDISDEEWELTFAVNVHAMFYLTKAAVPHMKEGSSIINTASINADAPNPTLLAYAATKGAVQNFTAGLAQLLAEEGIRANAVAPGPIWTPLIPSTMPEDRVAEFGRNVPMKRPGQPAEVATAYVMLADPMSSRADRINGREYTRVRSIESVLVPFNLFARRDRATPVESSDDSHPNPRRAVSGQIGMTWNPRQWRGSYVRI
jgi:hypothetical protein